MISHRKLKKVTKIACAHPLVIITGSRKIGKTTFLHHLHQFLQTSSIALQFSADDAAMIDNAQLQSLHQKYHHTDTKVFLCIDDIQHNPGLANLINESRNKYPKIHWIVTCMPPDAADVAKIINIAYIHTLQPMHFGDFFALHANNRIPHIPVTKITKLTDWYVQYQTILHKLFVEYMIFGGYPQVVHAASSDKKIKALDRILKQIIYKDITNNEEIGHIYDTYDLLRHIFNRQGQRMHVQNIAELVNQPTEDIDTLLQILYTQHICHHISRQHKTAEHKLYSNDIGLAHYIMGKNVHGKLHDDIGAGVENMVYNYFRTKKYFTDIRYYQTPDTKEIDFIIDTNDNQQIIVEVKHRKKPIIPSLFHTFPKPKNKNIHKVVITKNTLKTENNVHFVPAPLLHAVRFGVQ